MKPLPYQMAEGDRVELPVDFKGTRCALPDYGTVLQLTGRYAKWCLYGICRAACAGIFARRMQRRPGSGARGRTAHTIASSGRWSWRSASRGAPSRPDPERFERAYVPTDKGNIFGAGS